MLTVSKLAQLAAVSSDAVRFYAKEGLIAAAAKTAAGYRLYDERAVRRIRFIKQAQKCGFRLTEIRELLTLRNNHQACCQDIRSVAVEKKLQLEHKVKMLQSMSQALTHLITACHDGTQALDGCPILAALESPLKPISEGYHG